MKNKSLVTVVSVCVGAVLIIVGIFKVIPMIIGQQQDAPIEIIAQEEIIEVTSNNDDSAPKQTAYTEITSIEQVNQLAQDTMPAVIKFYAPWCGACQYMNGFYGDVAQAVPAVTFYSIDVGNKKVMDRVEELQLIAKPIEYLPTLVYRANGQVVDQKTGAQEKAALVTFVKTTFKI